MENAEAYSDIESTVRFLLTIGPFMALGVWKCLFRGVPVVFILEVTVAAFLAAALGQSWTLPTSSLFLIFCAEIVTVAFLIYRDVTKNR